MKNIFSVLLLTCSFGYSFAQSGDLIVSVDFVDDIHCATFNVNLSGPNDYFIYYRNIKSGDTLQKLPPGLYRAQFFSCDSAYNYSQQIEIVEGKTRYFYYRNNADISDYNGYYFDELYTDEYYDEYYDSTYAPEYFGTHIQFSRGIDLNNTNPNLLNNFAFDYLFGQDFLLTKPIALGYEFGFGYAQVNYISEDLNDPQIVHEKQRFTSFDISLAAVTSLYIKDRRMLTLGTRYRLPYFARYARVTGDDKLSTRGLHKYNDFSVFAMLGYDWGYIFAEYRFDQYLKAPLGDLPQLSLGIRLSAWESW